MASYHSYHINRPKFRGPLLQKLLRLLKPAYRLPAVFLLLFAGATDAAIERWISVDPYGGYVRGLVIDPSRPDTLYAVTDLGGIFKSTDGAGNWQHAGRSARTLAIDPGQPEILYAAPLAGGSFYKSVNGGGDWSSANRGLAAGEPHWPWPDRSFFWMDPAPPVTLYIHAETSPKAVLYVSVDKGGEWTQFESDTPEYAAFFENSDIFRTAFVSAGDVRMYADGATVYRRVGEGPWIAAETFAASSVAQLAAVPADPAAVYAVTDDGTLLKSADGGTHWAGVNIDPPGLKVLCVAIDPVTPAILYAGTNYYGVLKSTDGGRQWNAANNGLAGNTDVLSLALDPIHPGTMYAGMLSTHDSSVLKSTDGGNTWVRAGAGLLTFPVILRMDPLDTATLYAAYIFENDIFKTADGGKSWFSVSAGLPAGINNIFALETDPVTPGTLYVGAELSGDWFMRPPILFKSADGGNTWAAADIAVWSSNFTVVDIAIDPVTPGVLYASVYLGGQDLPNVSKSDDGGQTWRVAGSGISQTSRVVIDPAAPGRVYAAANTHDNYEVFMSDDGGENWTSLTPPEYSGDQIKIGGRLLIDPVMSSVLYTTSMRRDKYKNFVISPDRGETWAIIRDMYKVFKWPAAVDPVRSGILYLGGKNGEIAVIDAEPYLEIPRTGFAVDAVNAPIKTETGFSGGVSVNGGRFQREAVMTSGAPFLVEGVIETDEADTGKTADI
ncbi:MAG: hypothetical protein GY862_18625, partial [Gammaproteobacteria bacterium]|nr:hypothetical protein [Gammaproteobacteria bacterium]